MKKDPVIIGVPALEEVLERYFRSAGRLNYAVKILGHPGVGKSAVVSQVAKRMNYLFIDTRLAFKENVDLGGYPVPDPGLRRMIYYRPKFIPPEEVPAGFEGAVWFLDEANRAHPTVIQTLFQIITERTCGEHPLPHDTAIVLAGNLGEDDATTITEFDDSALDGRLAVFQLKPSAADWLAWARVEGIHPSVLRYISLFPDRLWDEAGINPNPRGWHQVSLAVTESYGLAGETELADHLAANPDGTLSDIIQSLLTRVPARDFILQITAPREITSSQVLSGDPDRLAALSRGEIPVEDLLWAATGACGSLRDLAVERRGDLSDGDLRTLGNVLAFIGAARADVRVSFFYLILRDCGLFSRVPDAIRALPDLQMRESLFQKFGEIIAPDGEDAAE